MVVHQNGWFIRENLTKMDDLGVPSFQETRMCFFFWLEVGFQVAGSGDVLPPAAKLAP